jgi:hypothetical protein
LKLVLLNTVSNTWLLSRLSCVSQGIRQTAADVIRRDLQTLLPTAVLRNVCLRHTDEVNWLCQTAGPTAVGSAALARAVLLELDHVDWIIAATLARNGEHVKRS